MRRRNLKKNVDLSYSQDEDEDFQEDSLNEDYVEIKRAAKKAKKNKKKPTKTGSRRQLDQSQESDSNNYQVIEFKHNDQEAKQHIRPSFIQRWNGIDNELQILAAQYKEMSPMFKVYWETKSKNMNAIIFLQFGKMEFFAFENDAIRLHEMFKKKLKKFSNFLMVGFWCKEILIVKQELFDKGIPVLMMNQLNDPLYRSQHGLIRRQIDQVITPGLHLSMEDKAYKERWFMAFYVLDIKESLSKRMGSKKEEKSIELSQQQPKKACVILLDSESNKFFIQEFQVDQKLHDVRRVINRYRPVQLLLYKSSSVYIKNIKQIARQVCSPYIIQIGYDRENEKVLQTLQRFTRDSKAPLFKYLFNECIKQKKNDPGFSSFATVKCLDIIHVYFQNMKLKEKIFDQGIFQYSCLNQAKLKPFFDSQVYQNLQIFRIKNQDEGEGKKGTLIAYLDDCLTNSGKKLLRRWINEPLTRVDSIIERQQCFKQIVQNQRFSALISFHQKLIAYQKLQKNIADVYHWVVKGYQKNYHKLTADLTFEKDYDQKKNPAITRIKQIIRILNLLNQFKKYLVQIKSFKLKSKYWKKFTQITSLTQIKLKKIQSGQQKLEHIPQIQEIMDSILKKIDYNQTTDFLEPTKGISPDYDREKSSKMKIEEQLEKELEKYKTNFNNNKISFVSVRARNEIQIPKICLKNKDRPKALVFSSQTASFQRYTTAKTNDLSEQLKIHEQRIARCYEPFLYDIIEEFCEHKFIWNKYVEAISEIDVLFSIAKLCKMMAPRFLPKFCQDDENSIVDIRKALHPGLIQVLKQNQLVSNSLSMKNSQRFLLLTGPNMGGKSTLLRQTCLLAILAQMGSYLPCEYYQSIVYDQIFCRIGSSDRIVEGKSTFYVELEETNRILKQATSSSLVIIDELGRGTSTYDGMAIAQATIDFILENIGCYTLFSTHYTPITRDFLSHDQVKCAKMSYKFIKNSDQKIKNQVEQKLQFLYQVEQGVAQKSFANNVAEIVGLPHQILIEADEKAKWISELHEEAQKKWKKSKNLNILAEMGLIKQKKKIFEI